MHDIYRRAQFLNQQTEPSKKYSHASGCILETHTYTSHLEAPPPTIEGLSEERDPTRSTKIRESNLLKLFYKISACETRNAPKQNIGNKAKPVKDKNRTEKPFTRYS